MQYHETISIAYYIYNQEALLGITIYRATIEAVDFCVICRGLFYPCLCQHP